MARHYYTLSIVVASGGVGSASASAASYASALKRYPYVTDVVGNSATLNWGTERRRAPGRPPGGRSSGGLHADEHGDSHQGVHHRRLKSEYQWTAPITFPPRDLLLPGATRDHDLLGTDPSPQVTTAAAPGSSVFVRRAR